jgi:putative oxidoreductase
MGLDRSRYAGWGIALIRVVIGLMLVYSGYLKFIAMEGTVGFFGMVQIPSPGIVAPIIGAGEVLGGILLVLGLGIRYVPWWFIAMFLVTTLYVKLPREAPIFGYDAARIDIMLLIGNVMLLLEGAGAFALDAYLAKRRASTEVRAQAVRA